MTSRLFLITFLQVSFLLFLFYGHLSQQRLFLLAFTTPVPCYLEALQICGLQSRTKTACDLPTLVVWEEGQHPEGPGKQAPAGQSVSFSLPKAFFILKGGHTPILFTALPPSYSHQVPTERLVEVEALMEAFCLH